MLENVKWERFCQAYAQDGNATAAYKAAGYTSRNDNSAGACGRRLLQNDTIQHRIRELTEQARRVEEKSAIADIREIREVMTQIVRGQIEDTKPADRIKAGDFLARVGGQMEPPTVRLELTLAEKRARLRELLLDDDDGDD